MASLMKQRMGRHQAESWRLVSAIQGGDVSAFDSLYERYRKDVGRFVYSMVQNWHVTEDVRSETFLRALRAIPTLAYHGHDVRAWLFTIARNIVRDQAKSSRARTELLTDALPVTEAGDDLPEATAIAQSRRAELLSYLDLITAEQRRCVELRFLHDMTVRETAEAMGKSEPAVRTLQFRAIRELAKIIPAHLR